MGVDIATAGKMPATPKKPRLAVIKVLIFAKNEATAEIDLREKKS